MTPLPNLLLLLLPLRIVHLTLSVLYQSIHSRFDSFLFYYSLHSLLHFSLSTRIHTNIQPSYLVVYCVACTPSIPLAINTTTTVHKHALNSFHSTLSLFLFLSLSLFLSKQSHLYFPSLFLSLKSTDKKTSPPAIPLLLPCLTPPKQWEI
ncbi:MAG: hypothetical protein JOS17DRAFT_557145 [Linnemannia elongata]|nr:MAG: hypothetical protein JOS17DRAFT_557145 [Linnemannia elongata]